MICNAELCPNCFSVNISVQTVVFRRQFKKNRQFQAKLSVFEICPQNLCFDDKRFVLDDGIHTRAYFFILGILTDSYKQKRFKKILTKRKDSHR